MANQVLQDGRLVFRNVATGQVGSVPAEDAERFAKNPDFRPVTAEEYAQEQERAKAQALSGKAETFARGAAESVGTLAQTVAKYSVPGLTGMYSAVGKPFGIDVTDTARPVAGQVAGFVGGTEAEREYSERERLLREVNPGSYTTGQFTGQLAAGLATGGVTTAAGKTIASGLAARGLGQTAARIAGTGLSMAAEGGVYGAATAETQAREAGQTDGATAEQLLQGIGLGALLAGGIGAAGSGSSALFRRIAAAERKAVAPVVAAEAKAARAAMTGTPEDAIARLSSQVSGAEYETLAKYGPHVNTPEAQEARALWRNRDQIIESKVSPMSKDLQAMQDAFEPVTDIVRNPTIRKEFVEQLPESLKPQAARAGLAEINRTVAAAREILDSLPKNEYTKSSRSALQRFIDFGDSTFERTARGDTIRAADVNAAANSVKQEAQRIVTSLGDSADKAVSGEAKRYARETAQAFEANAQEPLRLHLEDESIWGIAGKGQKEINQRWVNLLGDRGILTRFQDELFGKGAKEYMSRRPYLFADTAKIKSWLSSAGTAAGETRQAMVRDAVEAIDDLATTIGKYHEMGPGQAKQLEALQSASQRMRSALADVDKTVGIANEIESGIMSADRQGIGQLVSPGAMAATGAFLAGPIGALAGAGIGMLARPGAAMTARQVIESVAGRFGMATQRGASSWISDVIGATKRTAGSAASGAARVTKAAVPAITQFIGRDNDLDRAYDKKFGTLIQAQNDPNVLLDSLVNATGNLAEIDPRLASALLTKTQTAVNFLASKAPAGTLDPTALQPNRKAVVSDLDKKRFARVWMAVEKPETVLADLRRGVATPDQIEALQTVHPETYQAIRETVVNALADADRKGVRLPIGVRSQLDMLLDLGGAGIPALGPEIAGRIQSIQAAKQQRPRQQKKAPNLVASVKLPQQSWPSAGV